MKNIILYGAGNYCDQYLKYMCSEYEKIICIVDGNCRKWGKRKGNYEIFAPDILKKTEYDKLIITIEEAGKLVEELPEKYDVKDKIYFFDAHEKSVLTLAEYKAKMLYKKKQEKDAQEQIKMGLLFEAIAEGEFNYSTIIGVIGEKEDFQFIRAFFEYIMPDKKVIKVEAVSNSYNECKIIICCQDYKEKIKEIRKIIEDDEKWVLIPFFDVESTIKM